MNRPAERAGGRAPSGSNSAGAKGAILLVVAAILGIVLLQAFDTDDGGSGLVAVNTTVATGNGSTDPTLPPAQTTPTAPAGRAASEVIVLVSNGTGIKGLGSQTADALRVVGYNTLTAVDATKTLGTSTVQYAEGYEAEGRAIGLVLGLPPAAVLALNSPSVSDTQGAHVIVLLGADPNRTTTSTTAP